MSLDKIVKKIKEQADKESASIIDGAKAQEQEVLQKLGASLDKMEKSIKKEEAVIENEIKNAVVLPARLSVRGEELHAKNDMVDRAFRESISFDDVDYKKVLSHLFADIPPVSGGTLYPAEGKEKPTMEFVKENKISVEIGEAISGIGGGFLLKAGKVEYDCSFTTLLKKIKEKLEPKIAPLFGV
jgi:V/A-type H+-transporting ATPase subunit E